MIGGLAGYHVTDGAALADHLQKRREYDTHTTEGKEDGTGTNKSTSTQQQQQQ